MAKIPLRRSWSFKVTDFGTNRNLMYKFVLVINTNLPPILHRFRDIAFDRSKIAIFGQGTKWHRNSAENFNRLLLSTADERYRQTRQTDERATAYSERAGRLLSARHQQCNKSAQIIPKGFVLGTSCRLVSSISSSSTTDVRMGKRMGALTAQKSCLHRGKIW